MPKISALPPMTTADAADEAPIVDKSATQTKKWTLTLLLSYLQSLTSWITNAMVASGFAVQHVIAQTGAVATGTTNIPSDDTIPQNTEGTQFMTVSITPKSATNKLIIEGILFGSHSNSAEQVVTLFKDSDANALTVGQSYGGVATEMNSIPVRAEIVAGSTSPITFKMRAGGHNAGTFTFNGQGGLRKFGGVTLSSLKVTEYKA